MSGGREQVDVPSSGTGGDPQPQAKRGQLLEGEDPRTLRADDAMHWMTVYLELVSYADGLLALATRQQDGLSSTALGGKDADGDTRVLRRRLAWYRRRLGFWAGRLSELRPE